MKKRIYIILLLLAIILTGCSAGKKELIGTWSGEADVTQLVKDVLESNEEDEFADYLSIPELKLDCTVTFTTLSTFRVEIGKTSVEAMVAKIQEILKKAIEMTIGNPLNVMCGEAAHSFPPDFPPSHAGRAPFSAPGLPSD